PWSEAQAGPQPKPKPPLYAVVGVASWYGRPHHGRPTASEATYDMDALTAAHPTLPLGTSVEVTNLENGLSVVLEINDRGPFVAARIIDVSRRAAQILGFAHQGLTRVRIIAPRPLTGR
ncbi:MAG: septal ring lytic transglycosylase RlpA family protein, partial [Alphaproteobacteria bacterium]